MATPRGKARPTDYTPRLRLRNATAVGVLSSTPGRSSVTDLPVDVPETGMVCPVFLGYVSFYASLARLADASA